MQTSKTGRTLYCGALTLQSLSGSGYKTNYFDVDTGEAYWVSGPRRDGNDPLYPGVVEVDANVRDEYWRCIRDRPECVDIVSFRAPGKYSKRRPHPDNNRRRPA